MSRQNSMLSWVMHENSFITSWPEYPYTDNLEYSNVISSGYARFASTETIRKIEIQ